MIVWLTLRRRVHKLKNVLPTKAWAPLWRARLVYSYFIKWTPQNSSTSVPLCCFGFFGKQFCSFLHVYMFL